jgi:hypothetical protein
MTRWSSSAACAPLVLWLGGAALPLAAQQAPAREVPKELACGVQSPVKAPVPALQVLGGTEPKKVQFVPGETVRINAGTAQGVRQGQEYYVRRLIADRFTEPMPKVFPVSVHTSGWLTITEAQAESSVGTIAFACGDSIQVGDYLEPFEAPQPEPAPIAAGEPDFARPGHLILADERRQLGAPGVLMVLDRGTAHAVRPGQRLTIFRVAGPGAPPTVVGTATAMVVRPDTSLIRIETASDVIYVGDLVAIHR